MSRRSAVTSSGAHTSAPSTRAGGRSPKPAPDRVFACAGDDEWCLIEARTEDELTTLRGVVGDDLDVDAWTETRTPHEVMTELQALGLPAAAMLRLPELLDDPQLQHRGTYTKMQHPALDFELPTEDPSAPYSNLGEVTLRPAPAVAEHTLEVCAEVLALTPARVEELLTSGAITAAAEVSGASMPGHGR